MEEEQDGDAEITRGEEEVTDWSRIIRTRRAGGDRRTSKCAIDKRTLARRELTSDGTTAQV